LAILVSYFGAFTFPLSIEVIEPNRGYLVSVILLIILELLVSARQLAQIHKAIFRETLFAEFRDFLPQISHHVADPQ